MKVPNVEVDHLLWGLSLSRLQNEGSQLEYLYRSILRKSIKATE